MLKYKDFLEQKKFGLPMWFIIGLILAVIIFLLLLYPQFKEIRSQSAKDSLSASAYQGLFTGFDHTKAIKWQEKKLELDWIYKAEKPFKVHTLRVSWLPEDSKFKMISLTSLEKKAKKARDFFYEAGGKTGNNTLINLDRKINLPDWSADLYFNSPISYSKDDPISLLITTDQPPPAGTVFTFLINEGLDSESSISITSK